jgi:hypothetical protein
MGPIATSPVAGLTSGWKKGKTTAAGATSMDGDPDEVGAATGIVSGATNAGITKFLSDRIKRGKGKTPLASLWFISRWPLIRT